MSEQIPILLLDGRLIEKHTRIGQLDTADFGSLVIETDHSRPLVIAMLTGITSPSNGMPAEKVLAKCLLNLEGAFPCDQESIDLLHRHFSATLKREWSAATMCCLAFDEHSAKVIMAGPYSGWLFRSGNDVDVQKPVRVGMPLANSWTDLARPINWRRPTLGFSGDIDTKPCWSVTALPNDKTAEWLLASHATLELVPLDLLEKYHCRDELSVDEQLEIYWKLMLHGFTPADSYGLILIRQHGIHSTAQIRSEA